MSISLNGLMVKGKDLPRPDEKVTLSFRLLPFSHVYHLKGVVVWVSANQDPYKFRGMGVRFLDLGADDEDRIAGYIEKA